MGRHSLRWAASIAAIASPALYAPALAQTPPPPPKFELPFANVEDRVNGVLAIMGFLVIPDVTTMSLSITDPGSGDPDLVLGQLAVPFTISKEFPLYLEGMVAWARYDPEFTATDGTINRPVRVKWNTAAATIGVGWDFSLTDHLVLRPIANLSVGYVASDAKLLQFRINDILDTELDFVRHGDLTTFGYGASLMLDYELYKPEYEIDVELRYSWMRLKAANNWNDDNGDRVILGEADIATANLWARWRAPISDWTAFNEPVRYVLELTHSEFTGDQKGVLGFDRLTSFGTGVELAPSGFIDRARVMGRYVVGDDVEGFSIGFAVTF